jgi:hypothetical protein
MQAAQHNNPDSKRSLRLALHAGTLGARAATARERVTQQHVRRFLLLAALLCLAAVPAIAQERAVEQYNVVITDEATGSLASYTQVRIYSVDPVENFRLAEDPVVQLPSKTYPMPGNPILLQLAPGRYELTVRVFWLPAEVHYLYFTVVDGTLNLVDILTVELPTELVTY